MSSLDHRGSARRRDLKQQQQQQPQQQLSPTSLALQLPTDRDYFFDRDHSRIPSPASSKYGVRPRSSFSKTRTLKDAFEATSRAPAMDINEGHSQPISIGGRTPSPNSRRQRDHSLPSPLSPPPGELLETYKRINDADDLADLVSEDDHDGYSRRSSKERRNRESSGSRDRQKTQFENGDNDLALNFSYLNNDSQRGNLSTYKRDEERLRNATASQVPIFSRANVGTRADDLQRREAEPEEDKVYEVDDGPQPALNVPKSWGNKSKSHRQWLSSITRQNGALSRGDKTPRRSDEFERKTETTLRKASRSRSPHRRLDMKESSANHAPAGDAIPNTPVVVYKGGYKDRSQGLRSDSRDLLRRLARTESPPQTDTPEPKKPIDQPLPDKTPVVIGAWVDTPATVRPTQTIDEDFTKELDSPSKSGSEIKRESTKPPTEKDTESNHKPEHRPDTKIEKQQSPELVKPKLPKSALESVIEDAKSNGNPLHLGDDTINSLQGLMDGADSGLSQFGDLDDQDIKEDLEAIVLEEDKRHSEKDVQSVDRLNNKIQSIIHSIHDAKTGLDGLADKIAPDIGIHSCHKDGKSCKACGNTRHSHGGEDIYLAIPIPRLWYRTAVSQRLRLTYVGWALITFAIWYISECLMCDQFCHPTVAEVCDGYCLQPDAPQFPFTIPTMLWRWSHLATILSPMLTISTAFFRLIAQVLGLWDGYVDDKNPLSDSGPSLGGITISGSYGIGVLSGIWSRSEKSSPVLSSSPAPYVPLSTPLQQVVEGYQIYGHASEGQVDSMDDDETL